MSSRCPVCRASFRSTSTCSRCGADLEPLMTLQVRAWHLREAARRALREGEASLAARLARQSQRLHRTPAGEALQELAESPEG